MSTDTQILMDYCAIGSVADLLNDYERPLKLKQFKEEQIESVMFPVVGGILYLHVSHIYHRYMSRIS